MKVGTTNGSTDRARMTLLPGRATLMTAKASISPITTSANVTARANEMLVKSAWHLPIFPARMSASPECHRGQPRESLSTAWLRTLNNSTAMPTMPGINKETRGATIKIRQHIERLRVIRICLFMPACHMTAHHCSSHAYQSLAHLSSVVSLATLKISTSSDEKSTPTVSPSESSLFMLSVSCTEENMIPSTSMKNLTVAPRQIFR